MKTYLLRIGSWLSQGVNCVFLFGHPDITVSARAYIEYRLKRNNRWRVAYHAINALFFWQNDHCMESFLDDVAFAREVLEMQRQSG